VAKDENEQFSDLPLQKKKQSTSKWGNKLQITWLSLCNITETLNTRSTYTSHTPVFLNFEYQLEMKNHQYHSTLKLANLINPNITFCIDTKI